MKVFSRLRRSRRGDSTVVGAIFFIIIALLFTRFLFEIYQIQSEVNQQDLLRAQEKMEISSVVFGQLVKYTQTDFSPSTVNVGSGDPQTGSTSDSYIGNTLPITNMNFTSSEGWSFTKAYYGIGSGSTGASGYLDSETIVTKFSFNPSSGTTAGATMNWTTRFHINLEDLGGASAITQVNFIWTRKVVSFDGVTGTASIKVYLKDPLGTARSVVNVTVSGVNVNEITSSIDLNTAWFTTGGTGFYSVIIRSDAELRYTGSGTPEFKVYFDNTGINVRNLAQVTDWEASLFIEENPDNVKNLDLAYTGHYNASVKQIISLHDFTTNSWTLIDRSSISTTSVEIEKAFEGSEASPYISSFGEVHLRVQSLKSSAFVAYADAIRVEIVEAGATPDKITVTYRNPGGLTVVVTRLWILDSNAHYNIDNETILTPGLSLTLTYTYSYAVGKITFRAITERGNIVAFSTTAV